MNIQALVGSVRCVYMSHPACEYNSLTNAFLSHRKVSGMIVITMHSNSVTFVTVEGTGSWKERCKNSQMEDRGCDGDGGDGDEGG